MINLVEMHAAPGHRDAFTFVLVEHWPSAEAMAAFIKSEFANETRLAKYLALSSGGLPALRQFTSLALSAG